MVMLPFGDFFPTIAKRLGATPCAACQARAIAMNDFLPRFFRWPWDPPRNCHTFTGACTGTGTRRCVSAPASFTPDALTIEQCCNGWFQYPWIEICEGEPPRRGCGFCLW